MSVQPELARVSKEISIYIDPTGNLEWVRKANHIRSGMLIFPNFDYI